MPLSSKTSKIANLKATPSKTSSKKTRSKNRPRSAPSRVLRKNPVGRNRMTSVLTDPNTGYLIQSYLKKNGTKPQLLSKTISERMKAQNGYKKVVSGTKYPRRTQYGPTSRSSFNTSHSLLPGMNEMQYKPGVTAYHRYKGEFKDGKMHGKGVYETPSYIYKGEFKNGRLNGKGVLLDKKGGRLSWKGTFAPLDTSETSYGRLVKPKSFLQSHKLIGSKPHFSKINNEGWSNDYSKYSINNKIIY